MCGLFRGVCVFFISGGMHGFLGVCGFFWGCAWFFRGVCMVFSGGV